MRFSPRWLPLLFPPALSAQVGAGVAGSVPVVAHVEIDQADIFDSSETHTILSRLANRLHAVTRRDVISRELLFRPGEAYDSARFQETERNLRSMGIFRSVKVDTVSTDSGLVARVITKDGWTTRPDVGFSSTGGQFAYSLELLEDNLLGTATLANVVFRREPDRTTTSYTFRRSRLTGGQIGMAAGYASGTDGYATELSLFSPFRSLSNRWGASLAFARSDYRRPRYFEGAKIPGDSVSQQLTRVQAALAWALSAGSDGYFHIGMAGVVQRRQIRETGLPASAERTTATIGPTIEWLRAHFQVIRGFRSLVRTEDIDLSTALALETQIGLRAWGQSRDGVESMVHARTGMRLPHGFLRGNIELSGLLTAGGIDSGSVTGGATFTLRPQRKHLLVIHADAGFLYHPIPGQEFDLGFNSGPRGFPAHAFTGDRRIFLTGEYRWTMSSSLFNVVAVALAAFAEQGGAWFSGSSPRLGTDAGLGLRLDTSRQARSEFLRVDLVRTFATDALPGRWTLVLGKGFLF
jgi:hypothetical protein